MKKFTAKGREIVSRETSLRVETAKGEIFHPAPAADSEATSAAFFVVHNNRVTKLPY
jgi:hypothetical protein